MVTERYLRVVEKELNIVVEKEFNISGVSTSYVIFYSLNYVSIL